MADKDHLNMIITGHIDNGKSTTMGHFLMDLGIIDERTIAQHAEESEKIGATEYHAESVDSRPLCIRDDHNHNKIHRNLDV